MSRSPLKPEELESREAGFLKIARRLFLSHGLEGLTMERLAASTAYSKGTLYQHFGSKEDLLSALSLESGEFRLKLLQRAAKFEGKSRERAIAIAKTDYIVFKLQPDYWKTEQLMNALSLGTKISPERRRAMDEQAEKSALIAVNVIRDAVACGDLKLPAALTPEQVFLGLLGASHGLYVYCSPDSPLRQWTGDHWATHEKLFGCACDGFGWHPFSADWDYRATVRRVWQEVFSQEASKLGISFEESSKPSNACMV